jgi:heme/copper-type cytochrome/quinol oxidase subunit 2
MALILSESKPFVDEIPLVKRIQYSNMHKYSHEQDLDIKARFLSRMSPLLIIGNTALSQDAYFLPHNFQVTFQEPVTQIMYGIIDLHHDIMFILVYIITFVTWMLLRTIVFFKAANQSKTQIRSNITHNSLLEIIWTMIPTFILMTIAYPSFMLLYAMDAIRNPVLTVKIIGNQWYWTYNCALNANYIPNSIGEYNVEWKQLPSKIDAGFDVNGLPKEYLYIHILDIYKDWWNENKKTLSWNNLNSLKILQFDSYMIPDADLLNKNLRLLEVDKYLFIPMRTQIRLLVSANDVLHSWTIPSFGIKIDGCPGRQNEVPLNVFRHGTFFGQCSELCGINHAFMPIKVWVLDDYFHWHLAFNGA